MDDEVAVLDPEQVLEPRTPVAHQPDVREDEGAPCTSISASPAADPRGDHTRGAPPADCGGSARISSEVPAGIRIGEHA